MATVRTATRKKTIAIIGAGPAGLCALKSVLEREEYKNGEWEVTVFEAREDVCGVWLPAEPTSPTTPPLTPMYDSLTTNLPHPVMSFPGFPFPPETPLFPKAAVVLEYLRLYIQLYDLRSHIRLNTRVVNIDWNTEDERWVVETLPRTSGDGGKQEHRESTPADLVIVSNGHYSSPRFPTTPGVHEWVEKGVASHAMWYRRPRPPPSAEGSPRREIKILVVGAGPSGQDLVADFTSLPSSDSYSYTVIHSTTSSASESVPQPNGNTLLRRPCVSLYHSLASNARPTVTFDSGEVEEGVDHVYLATGYSYSYPFLPPHILKEGYPSSLNSEGGASQGEILVEGEGLWNTGDSVHHLARHVWPVSLSSPPYSALPYPPTSLAFLALPFLVAPFPFVDAQARAVLAAFSDPALFNGGKEAGLVRERYREALGQGADGGKEGTKEKRSRWEKWHVFQGSSEQFDYGEFLPQDAHHRIPAWHLRIYEAKNALRQRWRALEKSGDWTKYVKGVGSDGWDKERGGYGTEESAREAEKLWEDVCWNVLGDGKKA